MHITATVDMALWASNKNIGCDTTVRILVLRSPYLLSVEDVLIDKSAFQVLYFDTTLSASIGVRPHYKGNSCD